MKFTQKKSEFKSFEKGKLTLRKLYSNLGVSCTHYFLVKHFTQIKSNYTQNTE